MKPEWKPDICIYHFPCDDGFAAAWVVHQRWGDDVDFRPSNYGQPVPDHDIKGKNILIVDFSFKPDVLKAMGGKADSIIILDHHKTAEADLHEFRRGAHHSIRATFDMERSGARMTWDYCFPNDDVPELIKVIEDRDLWRFNLPHTKAVSLYLRSIEYDFYAWSEAVMLLDAHPDYLIGEGQAIKRFYNIKVAEIVKTAITKTIGNHEGVAVAYAPYAFVSDVGHALLDAHPAAPFACIIVDAHGGRTYSLRSRDDREDVSAVAKSFGGGGHRNAAGFRVASHQMAPSRRTSICTCKMLPS